MVILISLRIAAKLIIFMICGRVRLPTRVAGWHGTMTRTVDRTGGEQSDKYGTFVTGDGNFVVYDRENPDAWIQSDFALDLSGQ